MSVLHNCVTRSFFLRMDDIRMDQSLRKAGHCIYISEKM